MSSPTRTYAPAWRLGQEAEQPHPRERARQAARKGVLRCGGRRAVRFPGYPDQRGCLRGGLPASR